MQAITVAIGPKGTAYFNNRWVLGVLKTALQNPSHVADHSFSSATIGDYEDRKNLNVSLTNGSLSGFAPEATSFVQQENGKFQLVFVGRNLTLHYDWRETYDLRHEFYDPQTGYYSETWSNEVAGPFPFDQPVPTLTCTVTVGFKFNAGAYEVDLVDPSPTAVSSGISSLNLPAGSILVWSKTCLDPHVGEVETKAIAGLANNFGAEIQSHFPAVFASIPSSGQLTNNIKFEFGLGSSGLIFPDDNNGIEIGATGTVTWKGSSYPGTPPAGLPVPPVPTDQHHLQMYVSNCEFDALYWAFFKDGGLTAIVQPSDLPDPSILQANTYVSAIPAFKPYSGKAVQALVQPSVAPTTSFQQVWVLSTPVMNVLKSQLPSNVYGDLQGISGNAYVTQVSFESDLKSAGVATTYVATIETAAKAMGAAVQQTIEFTLTIEGTNINPPPNLVFTVTRTDVLQNLGLGLAGNAQTLQFAFTKSSATAAFVSTNIPHFDKADFGDLLWPVAGEPRYDQLLQDMGKKGVPLPIMQGFQFDFDQAVLSIQQGYVSVLADVKLKS